MKKLYLYLVLAICSIAFAQYTGGSGDGFGIWESTGDLSLPVTLLRFECVGEEQDILINWETASEPENLGYVVERKSTTEKSFSRIDSYLNNPALQRNGESSSGGRYSFMDRDIEPDRLYQYRILSVSNSGELDLMFQTSEVKTSSKLPVAAFIKQNYPNPFNPTTTIPIRLEHSGRIRLDIYNSAGQLIEVLENRELAAGIYKYRFTLSAALSSGIYICRLKTDQFESFIKLAYLK